MGKGANARVRVKAEQVSWLRIKRLRIERRYLQSDVARAIGIARPYYANIENCKVVPSERVARLLTGYFGTDYTFLFGHCEPLETKRRKCK